MARRLVAAEDPLYLQTLDLRMALYAPADLFFNYFPPVICAGTATSRPSAT
ncbi:MAG: hypothetical protein R2856_06470 [Caldilineaceae bacterium]